MEGNNDDEEPQICTVFSSTPSSHSKTIFDTIAFSVPKKENSVLSPTSPFSEDEGPSTSHSVESKLEPEINVSTDASENEVLPASTMFESLSMSYIGNIPTSTVPAESIPVTPADAPASVLSYSEQKAQVSAPFTLTNTVNVDTEPVVVGQCLNEENLRLVSKEIEALSLTGSSSTGESIGYDNADQQSPLPAANELFSNAPEVPFPVGLGSSFQAVESSMQNAMVNPTAVPFAQEAVEQIGMKPLDAFSTITYSSKDATYDAWIPCENTRQILMSIATSVNSGTYFPDKTNMTTPGVIYKEDLVSLEKINLIEIVVDMSNAFGS